MSKKMNSIARFKHYDTLLSCPICHTAMSITDSAICEQGHNFDFSKQGYLNLLVQNNATHYDKELLSHVVNSLQKAPFSHRYLNV